MPASDCPRLGARLPFATRPRWRTWLLGSLLLLNGGCQASDQAPLRWPVASPPPLQAEKPVLWVALAARLGPTGSGSVGSGEAAAAPAAPLVLQAAHGSLTLEDGAGRRFTAPQLTLHWRWEPLSQPFMVRRRVLGPFASFETAEAAARPWVASGHHPVIARPADWEVWAPADAPDPPGRSPTLVERRETRRLGLELRRAGTMALQDPIRLQAPGGLRWGQGTYSGPFRLLPDAHGGWSLVEEVPLERYLEGVVPHEIGAGAPPAAQAAQAVLARTWAVRNLGRFRADGYHLCADTQCQVYSDPGQATPAVRQAIATSRGQVLAAAEQPIHAVYHASNGGVAAGLEEAWDVEPVPYLRPFADGSAAFVERNPIPIGVGTLPALLGHGLGAYGADHPLFRWQRTLTAGAINAALGARGLSVGTPRGLKVLERGASGRVVALEISGASSTMVLRRDAIRRTLRQLPSTLFTATQTQPGSWLIQGGGFGHGAGLSQAGAIDLARRGWSMPTILRHYYPTAVLKPLGTLAPAVPEGG